MTRHGGWQKAMDAAWRAFGNRYWRVLVGVSIAGRLLPWAGVLVVVVGAIFGVRWLAGHAHAPDGPHIGFGWLAPAGIAAAVVLALLGAVWLGWRYWNPNLRLPSPKRALALAAAVFAATALWAWQRS